MTEVNAVFEGGGVKGIALVGALARSVTEKLIIKGYAGASAGAIVAALSNAGYDTTELKEILKTTDYMTFLDGNDVLSLEDLKSCINDIQSFLKETVLQR